MALPIHERFHAFQGEGVHMGQSAFFIRTYGCPVHCPWCDSAGTWHARWKPPEGVEHIAEEQLVREALACSSRFVVVTGGEPAIHELWLLTALLSAEGIPVHLETSGAFPIRGEFNWITVSPKRWKLPLAACLDMASEFKLIIESPEDIEFYTEMIVLNKWAPIWLHPEWSHREDSVVLSAISNAVKQSESVGLDYRAGCQLHKFYKVDALDSRTRPLVPLGGEIEKGF